MSTWAITASAGSAATSRAGLSAGIRERPGGWKSRLNEDLRRRAASVERSREKLEELGLL
jgi:hypothetical protein